MTDQPRSPVRDTPRKRSPGIRAARQIVRKEDALRAAARAFRRRGMNETTMADIAREMGVTKVVLYRRYSSKEALIEALFDNVVQVIRDADRGKWRGYGSRVRQRLKAIRTVEDSYIALVRDGELYSPSRKYGQELRAHSREMIQRILHFPEPENSGDPMAAGLCLETIVTFSTHSLMWWVQHGDPARDGDYLSWFAYMMKSWREGALKVFNLGDPNLVVPQGPVRLPHEDLNAAAGSAATRSRRRPGGS